VAELKRDHARQLVAIHHPHQAFRDAHHGMRRIPPGGESIRLRVRRDGKGRHRQAGARLLAAPIWFVRR